MTHSPTTVANNQSANNHAQQPNHRNNPHNIHKTPLSNKQQNIHQNKPKTKLKQSSPTTTKRNQTTHQNPTKQIKQTTKSQIHKQSNKTLTINQITAGKT